MRALELVQESGVGVVEVIPDSPAQRSDLRPRDIILSIADVPIASVDDLHRFLDEHPVGESYEMIVFRGGKAMGLAVRPEESPA